MTWTPQYGVWGVISPGIAETWSPIPMPPDFQDFLRVQNSNNGVDATLRTVTDGKGDPTPLRASTAEIAIDATRATGGTVTRPLGDHLRDDGVNVADQGAVPDGVTSNTAAFAAAYSIAANGGAALVLPGAYAGTMPVESGGKRLLWRTDGATDASGTVPLDLPGYSEGMFQGRRLFRQVNGAAGDVTAWDFQRNVSYTGGTPFFTNNAVRVSTYVTGAGGAAFEWPLLALLDTTHNTDAQHCAAYFRGIKRGTGVVFGACSEVTDLSISPTRSSIAHEFNVYANGADANNQRIVLDVQPGRVGGVGSTPEIYAGLRIIPQGLDTANAFFKNWIVLDGNVGTGIATDGAGTFLLRDLGAWTVGLDLIGGTYSAAAIRIPSNALITLDSSGANALRFNSAANMVEFALSGTAFFQTNGNGIVNVAGATPQYQVSGTQVLTTRRPGWSAPTGTATRTTFATGTVTLPQLAERVKALIDDLTTHGLIGA